MERFTEMILMLSIDVRHLSSRHAQHINLNGDFHWLLMRDDLHGNLLSGMLTSSS